MNPFGGIPKGNIFTPLGTFEPKPVIAKRRTRSKAVQKPFGRRSGRQHFVAFLSPGNHAPKDDFGGSSRPHDGRFDRSGRSKPGVLLSLIRFLGASKIQWQLCKQLEAHDLEIQRGLVMY